MHTLPPDRTNAARRPLLLLLAAALAAVLALCGAPLLLRSGRVRPARVTGSGDDEGAPLPASGPGRES